MFVFQLEFELSLLPFQGAERGGGGRGSKVMPPSRPKATEIRHWAVAKVKAKCCARFIMFSLSGHKKIICICLPRPAPSRLVVVWLSSSWYRSLRDQPREVLPYALALARVP